MTTSLINAEELSAVYDPETHELSLEAKGQILQGTVNIHFVRQPDAEGLLYELVATRIAISKFAIPYDKVQKESVTITPFPKDVIIKTAAKPDGEPVEIHYGVVELPPLTDAPSSIDGNGAGPTIPAPNQETIRDQLNTPFTIKHTARVDSKGSVTIEFDTTYLDLIGASIEDTLIVWKFKGIKTGSTQVRVVENPGAGKFIMHFDYHVSIFNI